ncbi:MAG: hypothetical protein SGARI_002323 [Bacillariaceae sp.]
MTNLRILSSIFLLAQVSAFSSTSVCRTSPPPSTTTLRSSHLLASINDNAASKSKSNDSNNPLLAAGLALTITTAAMNPLPVEAYVPSDYASETVQNVISELKSASGNVDQTFKAYENIAGIITEGKGVGGMVNYSEKKKKKRMSAVSEEGYVADEDTSIYNPGLTLLTESEKERLVEAVIAARKEGLQKNQWSENNEFAFDFLREKLDPLHMVELGGFLKFAPFYAGLIYLAVLGVQQFSRDAFQIAYIVGVAAFFLPMLALVAAGV